MRKYSLIHKFYVLAFKLISENNEVVCKKPIYAGN